MTEKEKELYEALCYVADLIEYSSARHEFARVVRLLEADKSGQYRATVDRWARDGGYRAD
jgi:hypothetical protein